MNEVKFVIWGAGFKGKKLFKILSRSRTVAFIDSAPKKIGMNIEGLPIISFEEYKKKYADFFIVISNTEYCEIEKKLIEEKLYRYFILSDCPSEFLGYGINNLEQLLEWGDVVENTDCYIWGANLYSIVLINRFMTEKKYTNMYCIPHKRIRTETVREIENMYGIQMVENPCVLQNVHGDLYLTVRDKCCKSLENNTKLKKINTYDFSRRFPDYKHGELEKFKNKHNGERCFIVATGPSLKKEDVEILWKNKEKTFGVNRIFNLNNCMWRPDYYVVLDHMVICKNIKEISEYNVLHKFINDCAVEFWNSPVSKGNCYKIHGITDDLSDEEPLFSEDMTTGVYTGATVTYSCIQLAIYMGFTEIFLLGVDCNYVAGSQNNYFFKESDKDTVNHRENRMIESYIAAKKYADAHGIRIRNATRGGKLEVFDRVNFDELFA